MATKCPECGSKREDCGHRYRAPKNHSNKTSEEYATNKPTAEEVCRTIEIWTMFHDDGDPVIDLLYRMTHCRDGNSNCEHDDWVEEFRRHQAFWANENKAPRDATKLHDMKYPGKD